MCKLFEAFLPRRCVYFPHLPIHHRYSFYILVYAPILLCVNVNV